MNMDTKRKRPKKQPKKDKQLSSEIPFDEAIKALLAVPPKEKSKPQKKKEGKKKK
jgi:hypothetical protein